MVTLKHRGYPLNHEQMLRVLGILLRNYYLVNLTELEQRICSLVGSWRNVLRPVLTLILLPLLRHSLVVGGQMSGRSRLRSGARIGRGGILRLVVAGVRLGCILRDWVHLLGLVSGSDYGLVL